MVDWSDFVADKRDDWYFVCKHLCGGGTDHMIRKAVEGGIPTRAILVATCCFHKSCWEDYVNKRFLEEIGVTEENYDVIKKVSGFLNMEHTTKQPSLGADSLLLLGKMVARLWDLGRIKYLEQHGFTAFRTLFVSDRLTPQNGLIVAYRSPAKADTTANHC